MYLYNIISIVITYLMVEVSTDSIEPALRIDVNHRELDGKTFVVVQVPRGDSLHERGGRSWIRVGASKRRLTGDEPNALGAETDASPLPLVRQAGGSQYRLRNPKRVAVGAASQRCWGHRSDPAVWRTCASWSAMRRMCSALRSPVVLLCTKMPQEWLPHAIMTATHYRGRDRASEQLDAQEIDGPLQSQIADGMKFVARNMRVAARKSPARENIAQYSTAAVFEALVNAVAHRDYSISSRRIRLSMFADRLEIDTPGELPNGMTIESMHTSQATRNEVIASVFGRIPVGDVPGSAHRAFLMERRGDGVAIILKETQETAGVRPKYSLLGESSLVLSIPCGQARSHPGGGHRRGAFRRRAAAWNQCSRALSKQDMETGKDG